MEINGAVFSFENHVVTSVIFRRKNRKWTVADREPAVNLRKGTGLLDVYMTPMRIILPDSCPEPLRIAADHLAHPWTNGVDPRVYVDYPVYSASQAPKHCLEYGLILLDVNHSNDYIRMLRGFLLADYSAEGYCWQGTWHTGGYLLFQVIPNPYDRTRSILVISTNALPLLGKCLFLRRVILPYYYNGRHPFWNNQLLLFDGKEYRASYEDDGELLPIG